MADSIRGCEEERENLVRDIWRTEQFASMVAVFFALALLALGIAAFVGAPLSDSGWLCFDPRFWDCRCHGSYASRGVLRFSSGPPCRYASRGYQDKCFS